MRFLKSYILFLLLISVIICAGCGKISAHDNLSSKLDLAVKYLGQGKYDKAILAYNEVIKIDDKNLSAYKGLGKAYVLQQKYGEAEQIYQKGIKTVGEKQELLLCLAGLFREQNRVEDAKKLYNQMISLSSKNTLAYKGLAELLVDNGDTDEAVKLLEQFNSKNKNNLHGLNGLADILIKTGNKEKALDYIKQSLMKELNQEEPYTLLARVSDNNWEEIINYGSRVMPDEPGIGRTINILGYYNLGKYKEAINQFEGFDKIGPETYKAMIYAAMSYLKNEDSDKADQLIRKINIYSTDNPVLYADLAKYWLEKGKMAKAKSIAFKGMDLDQTCLEIYKVLYEIAVRDNDPNAKYYLYLMLTRTTVPLVDLKQFGIDNLLNSSTGAGFNMLTVDDFKTGLLTFTTIVIDVSGSMDDRSQDGVKIESAKTAALQMLELIAMENAEFGPKHAVSIIPFSSSARLVLPATCDIRSAIETVKGLHPGGGTNIGSAIEVANSQLAAVKAKKKVMILLSDGLAEDGMNGEQILSFPVEAARKAGNSIFTIGFGSPGEYDQHLLGAIANRTGGTFSYASGGYTLQNLYLKFRHETTGTILAEVQGQIKQDETQEIGKIDVANNLGQLHSTLNWGGSDLDLILRDPAGKVVDENYPGANIYKDKPAYVIVENPRPGKWSASTYGRDVPEKILDYDYLASVREREPVPLFELIMVAVFMLICLILTTWMIKGFCPQCGAKEEKMHRYCPWCGKQR